MRHAERRQDARHAAALVRGGNGEALAQRCAPGVDPNLAARLGVDEPELADVGELLLARVADLDREDVMPVEHAQKRRAPVERPAEVGDDGDDPTLPRDRADAAERAADGRRAGRGLRLAAERSE